jgi:AsmA-like C-terminal region
LRRRLLRIGAAGALLIASGLVGYLVATRLYPGRLRTEVERLLTEQVGPVEIGRVRPTFAWGPALEVRDVRTVGGGEHGDGLGAERAVLTLDPWALLSGRAELRRIALRGLWGHVVVGPGPGLRPEILGHLAGALSPPPPEPASAPPKSLRLPAVVVDDARIRLTRVPERGKGAPTTLDVEIYHVRARQEILRSHAIQLSAQGRFGHGRTSWLGGFELRAERESEGGATRVELALADADLGLLRPWLSELGAAGLQLTGRTSGYLNYRQGDDAPELDLDLLLSSFAAGYRLREGNAPYELDLGSARVRGRMQLGRKQVQLRDFELTSGSGRLAGSATLARPLRSGSALGLDARLEEVSLPAVGTLVRAAVRPEGDSPGIRFANALQAGELGSLALRSAPLPIEQWRRWLDSPIERWPEGVELQAQLRAAQIGIEGPEPVRDFDADLSWNAKRLQLDAKGSLAGNPLPQLHLELAGVRDLVDVISDPDRPARVPPLPGLLALREWVDAQSTPGQPSRWKRIQVDADWIDHPLLLRPLEHVQATLTPENPGLRVTLAGARWGGLRVQGSGRLSGEPPGRLELDLTAVPGQEDPDVPVREPGIWLRGRFDADIEKLGPFRAQRLSGQVRGREAMALLDDGQAWLEPRGHVTGKATLDLSERDFVPTEARLQLEDGSLSELMNDLDMDGDWATGELVLGANLHGQLRPRLPILAGLEGPVSAHSRDGEIRERLPFTLAIAAASETFNPFRSNKVLPYWGIDGEFRLDFGTLRSDSVSFYGPTERMVGTGAVDLIDPAHRLEAVVGVFFFRTLDVVIGKLPILNTFLLGPDDNLLSAYFSLEGPWADPEARLVTSKTLAQGPASFMVQGVPTFVRSGLSQLRRLFVAADAPSDPVGATP